MAEWGTSCKNKYAGGTFFQLFFGAAGAAAGAAAPVSRVTDSTSELSSSSLSSLLSSDESRSLCGVRRLGDRKSVV